MSESKKRRGRNRVVIIIFFVLVIIILSLGLVGIFTYKFVRIRFDTLFFSSQNDNILTVDLYKEIHRNPFDINEVWYRESVYHIDNEIFNNNSFTSALYERIRLDSNINNLTLRITHQNTITGVINYTTANILIPYLSSEIIVKSANRSSGLIDAQITDKTSLYVFDLLTTWI